nr:hypothetical protein Q903MT_gene1827 [Picea sitchensis]
MIGKALSLPLENKGGAGSQKPYPRTSISHHFNCLITSIVPSLLSIPSQNLYLCFPLPISLIQSIKPVVRPSLLV